MLGGTPRESGCLCRNPFLSRAGFDIYGYNVIDLIDELGRNPFLSRAGFDIDREGHWLCPRCVAIPF